MLFQPSEQNRLAKQPPIEEVNGSCSLGDDGHWPVNAGGCLPPAKSAGTTRVRLQKNLLSGHPIK
jgi:hypothetical protein